jgi:succinate dehydrogenase/fumarate reductase flavoprotein subunit
MHNEALVLDADVLVIGGGPAGSWAAWSAAKRGADVILVDKGYCGSSGATAPSGTGVWIIPPNQDDREKAKAQREALGGYLSDHDWMDRVLDRTWRNMDLVESWGYPFPRADGAAVRRGLQGPEYMKLMRKVARRAGVEILDHSPALELLVDRDGAVAGARGVQRQEDRPWTVRAGAVVIATGGCAFLSKALGCNNNTGDGYLFAAEAGGELSGMEFSSQFAVSTAFGSVTKTAHYSWAVFTNEAGDDLNAVKDGHYSASTIGRALLNGPVYAQLSKARERPEVQAFLRYAQPNFFLPLDRSGINPFTQRFPVTLTLEGTVRGTGGIRITDSTCASTVPGLFAAGDAATRELICGGFTGGGSHNAAWAMSSGSWAGEGAAEHALALGASAVTRDVSGAGFAGLHDKRASASVSDPDADAVIAGVQNEMLPLDKNLFRTERGLRASLTELDALWASLRGGPADANARDQQRSREAAALVATARWAYTSALERRETRGMHRRTDFPELDPQQRHYQITGGLDRVWLRTAAHAQPVETRPLAIAQ